MTEPVRIVGLAGFAGVGKSTQARHLVDRYSFRELSFAGPLKRIVQDLYGFTDDQMYGPSSSRNKPDERYPRGDGTYLTPRMALERFGTEAGRYCYKGTWCNAAIRDAKQVATRGRGVVFSDARFLNEFEAIRNAGGKVVRLVQTGINASTHESETEQAAIPDQWFDAVLCTDCSKDDTAAALDDLIVRWGWRG